MTEQLDWQYLDRECAQRATYNGLVIYAKQDQSPQNPFEEWDGNWPIIVRSPDSFRGFVSYDLDGKCALSRLAFPAEISEAQIVHDQFAIAEALGWTGPQRIAQIMEAYGTDDPVTYCREPDVLHDMFEQSLNDHSSSAVLGVYAELLKIAGVTCRLGVTNGYSQGDYAEVLVIASPEAQTRFGTTAPPTSDDLKATIDLYGAWAWGDVYGYVVETADGDELDSCWGYYGRHHDESGLEGAAINAADCALRAARQRRIDALKVVVRNRVPLDLRAEILDKAGALA